MTQKRRRKVTDGETLKGLRVIAVRTEEQAEAVREVMRSEGATVTTEDPDFVALWTGDVNRFEAGRDRAIILERTKDGAQRINAEPDFENRTIEFVKDTYKYYGGAATVVDPEAESFHEECEAKGLKGRLILLGDAEKFENGEELHAMTFTRVVMQRSETKPEDVPEVMDAMSNLYSAGLKARATLRTRNGYAV